MKDMHRDKAHPAPKGGGMPYFEKDHWQKSVNDITLADTKYGSEMNQLEEYTRSVDAQSAYFKKHKEKH